MKPKVGKPKTMFILVLVITKLQVNTWHGFPYQTGLEVFLTNNLQLDLNTQMRDFENTWTIPLLFDNGHIYIYLKPSMVKFCFTRTYLTKIHKQFMNPSAEKLLNLV